MNNKPALTADAPLESAASAFRAMALACLIVFMAQMATTVYLPSLPIVMRELKYGAHAMALCGFLQQGLAGIAATAAVLLHHDGAWTLAVFVLGVLTLLQVKLKVRGR
ncbi:hypothetical protein [Burkholderia ubonensis]|uniref:hypothetical protein n=1 Tax=Burkholderia ubonensis TaxID=101571 RepID=UPI000A8BC2E7|nr:hypothetical protein [Burkholderia ubonensis]